MPGTKSKVLDTGMIDYITKPFNANELFKKLAEILR
jgi:DNA-binding response OmpR family regulator